MEWRNLKFSLLLLFSFFFFVSIWGDLFYCVSLLRPARRRTLFKFIRGLRHMNWQQQQLAWMAEWERERDWRSSYEMRDRKNKIKRNWDEMAEWNVPIILVRHSLFPKKKARREHTTEQKEENSWREVKYVLRIYSALQENSSLEMKFQSGFLVLKMHEKCCRIWAGGIRDWIEGKYEKAHMGTEGISMLVQNRVQMIHRPVGLATMDIVSLPLSLVSSHSCGMNSNFHFTLHSNEQTSFGAPNTNLHSLYGNSAHSNELFASFCQSIYRINRNYAIECHEISFELQHSHSYQLLHVYLSLYSEELREQKPSSLLLAVSQLFSY